MSKKDYYWDADTIGHFKFESAYLTKKLLRDNVLEFVKAECTWRDDETEEDLVRVLTVLNKFKNTVSVYDVEGLVNEYEDFIESKGHMLNHCQWLVTDAPPALYHPELYYASRDEAYEDYEY